MNRSVPITHIYNERRHFNREIFNLSRFLDVPYTEIESRADLKSLNPAPGAVGVSYGVGIIFANTQIGKFEHGIWNIHPGKLPENRGRHPISWAFLMNESILCISIHQINELIDRGILLAEATVPRSISDTPAEFEDWYLDQFRDGLFERAVENYVSNNTISLSEGEYRRRLDGVYGAVDPADHDALFLFNLFKAQSVHGGVVVGSRTFTQCDFVLDDRLEEYKDSVIFGTKDGKRVALR